MNEKQIIHWIESQTKSKLSELQKEILKATGKGKTYQDIANAEGYNLQYVKDVGYRLWHLLSQICEEKITKKNFRVKIERIIQALANSVNNYQDWADAPDIHPFFGRKKELATLRQWIVNDYCRLVAIIGMKGIGKTKLSVKLAKELICKTDLPLHLTPGIQYEFEYVIWRSLLNPLPVKDFLTELIKILTNQEKTELSYCLEEQISRLIYLFKKHRCLVILDNVETILEGSTLAGRYRQEYRAYGQLFRQIGIVPHQSCLLLTSREKPDDLDRMAGINHPVRLLELDGLSYREGEAIFRAIGDFSGVDREWQTLATLYNGNPLALELAAHHIQAVFGGDIAQFLREGKYIFDDLRNLLNWHFERLSEAEKEIVYCLATNDKPVCLSKLKENLRSPETQYKITDILQSLTRRLVLKTSVAGYILQPMLREYIVS